MKKLMLIILDGWGLSSYRYSSAIEQAYTPFIDYCSNNYPFSKLIASGCDVGLPKGQMGNSEVGHINLGSGRKILQSLEEINISIKNNSFLKKIDVFFNKISISKNRIHFIGLLSDGGVHSHMDHLFYLLKIAHQKKIRDVFIHIFTDGRDSSPKKSIFYIQQLLNVTKQYVGKLSSVIGRYYSMDRDNKWERTKKAYDAMVYSKGIYTGNIISSIEKFYNNGITDEFLSPLIIIDKNGIPISRIKDGDVVFCFNFRPDRSRQITELLTGNNAIFSEMKKLDLSYYITMTCFNPKYRGIHVLFEKKYLSDTLGEVLEKEGKQQIRIAETEKYPHVTFFFSGGREAPFDREIRILCQSPKVSTYDLKPEMSAENIVKKIVPELKRKQSDFICLNFANPDMVGHTGKMEETIKACEFVDKCVKFCSEEAIKNSYTVIIVGDHGNADYMINSDGTPHTAHTTSLVPFILLDKNIKKQNISLKKEGILSDVAPTILQLMKLPIPKIMSGTSMIKKY
ncbi:2,3-bisphosphoglycerate-independent phosphoglycerate mutase [Blattabacterium sp. (Nauphoeta cinerea)]|uniref:2,3-bisphosphoglycerate-independent phosphoglycerate mutase n=1 Tax=Blattabacterium sp. (Nauphoeta cinerea) TaxID=1316444 RepID=UPI0003B02612|nr:2,3-bisphosphoglycerate-independent phosphoglycerate mutase [Blattabacterium sp. (Nauphoeta cinerea)]AGW86001.1 2,3-bisphosphoglycerate-independent phosphoglycerate mutase [Blattabacterium sp. (Nauphoeta cinerea)]